MNYFVTNILPFALLVFGFLLLIKGASVFVDYSSKFAKKIGVSQLFIALTIVAMGTSIPEAAVSLLAAMRGNAELSVGNIVGTNILNILLILGITSVIVPVAVKKSTVFFEIPIMIAVSVIFPFLGLGFSLFSIHPVQNGMFSRTDGCIFMVLFAIYLFYLKWLAGRSREENALMVVEKNVSAVSLVFFLVLGLGFIIAGSSLVVNGASKIALNLGVSERIVGLTIVAFGTSLPEMATSVTAALKGHDDMAAGNIVGSNIFNMLFIGGITALVAPAAYSSSFQIDSLVCIASSLVLMLCLLNRKRVLYRYAGGLLLVLYCAYMWFLLKV